ncbi:unnamed protein product [Aspergillus oryzae]|uniref:Unnamed protein product n=1 Tax=Aspergillus oryzae TaxID=5062 RepID=A0AAN4YZ67_ASPOZ|nr:unnamed protein product [Aspergillus oryzae]GMF84058.1 unnamed protein product [Aspergillus oryzae]GMG01539.1 unnamed protein product [Aspergillus oryzae]GMG38860.1 unnamed protein product [Aspergillus oryzae]
MSLIALSPHNPTATPKTSPNTMNEQFTWTSPNLNQHHFITFANLLALRNGGQVEPASSPHDSEEKEEEEDNPNNTNDADSINTTQVHQISDSGNTKLKRKFLDCLAELAANDKGARSSLKDCVHLFRDDQGDGFTTIRQGLLAFQNLIFDGNTPGQVMTDRHSLLVIKAYELRMMKPVRDLLQTSPHSTPRTKKLWENICFLGRLKVAFETFIKIALNLPSFKQVTIIPIPRDIGTQKALKSPLNLGQAFNLLDIPLDPSTVKKVIGHKWTFAKAKDSFRDLQKQKLNVHAEVQMILYLSKGRQTFDGLFQYFGCSKYSCFMCWHFLQAHSKIGTRGCHGRLFKPWSIPEVSGMTPGSWEKISNALIQLQRRLKKELKAEIKKGISQEKTSVVGGSSIFTNHDPNSARRKADIERMRIKAEQNRVAEAFKSIGEDRMPEEEDVCADFGFNYFESFADKSKLLGLYKGLWIQKVPVEDIHKWQVEGSLAANIKEVFYQVPERYRGGYFPWFLEHTQCLDTLITQEEATERTVTTFFDEARSYLDKEDRDKHFNELKPEVKRDCFYMLALTLHMAYPNPVDPPWFNFGFCTCYDEYQERALGGLFGKLLSGDNLFDDVPTSIPRMKNIQTATFTEFRKAYESGTMIQLMDSKGFKQYRLQFPYLEEFFRSPPCGPHLSVWSLKQFLAIYNPAESPPDNTISVDYGFMNCKTFTETCTLMELYKRLLRKASPLDLHEACVAGKLFEFAECFHKMDQAHRRLMKNFYPLSIE